MGDWQILINGHGIHDNGRADDVDAICTRFLAELAKSQDNLSCTFTLVGVSRQIPIPAGD